MKCRITLFVVVFVGFALASCSISRKQLPARTNKLVSEAVASPTPELVHTTRVGTFIVRHVSKEPVELLSVQTLDRPKALVMNFKNISEHEIKSVEYGISRHEQCAEYMYVFTASPRIIYGNEKSEMPISPGNEVSLRVPPSLELSKLLDSKTYATCSSDNRSPILMLAEVRFTDGSIWRPRARAF
jgi:hypothetical protein